MKTPTYDVALLNFFYCLRQCILFYRRDYLIISGLMNYRLLISIQHVQFVSGWLNNLFARKRLADTEHKISYRADNILFDNLKFTITQE